MGGERSFLTILLATLALVCLGILGARWATLARRTPLEPLPQRGAELSGDRADSRPRDRAPHTAAEAGRDAPDAAQQPATAAGIVDAAAAGAGAGAVKPAYSGTDSKRPPGGAAGKLDLNRATAAQFEALPGIGPALAQRIVDFRAQHGPFTRIEELLDVEGIGEGKLADIKGLVYVKPAS